MDIKLRICDSSVIVSVGDNDVTIIDERTGTGSAQIPTVLSSDKVVDKPVAQKRTRRVGRPKKVNGGSKYVSMTKYKENRNEYKRAIRNGILASLDKNKTKDRPVPASFIFNDLGIDKTRNKCLKAMFYDILKGLRESGTIKTNNLSRRQYADDDGSRYGHINGRTLGSLKGIGSLRLYYID